MLDKQQIHTLIKLDDHSATPKYQQLANAIVHAITTGKLVKNDVLPSINELSFEFEISRDTAEKGYRHLKNLGILGSVPGKGFYIKDAAVNQQLKIFLLFNKLSAHKKIIYDALVARLEQQAAIDFYIYNNDYALFKKLILNVGTTYTHYIIIPHFMEGGEHAHEILNTLDKNKLILLDKLVPGVSGNFAAVYENFEQDIYQALEQALGRLQRYQKLKIIFPEHTYFPQEIVTGFNRFCKHYQVAGQVISEIAGSQLARGDVFITLLENDLVTLIEQLLHSRLVPGRDVGVISYNETPLKRIILNGITTFSTDFQQMGETVADLILHPQINQVAIPFSVNLRPSL
ncbi:MAG: GntR family transcriptional regulator [Cyclobacteriaceae bacterium]|nr:GntR family transcriptional regulator [Cyclobacteriaceae bacterium]